MNWWLQDTYIWLGFIPKAAKLVIREQGQDNPERLRVLMDKIVNDIWSVVRKPGGKNANKMPNSGTRFQAE